MAGKGKGRRDLSGLFVAVVLVLSSCGSDEEEPKQTNTGGSAGASGSAGSDGSAGSSMGGADASPGGTGGTAGNAGSAGAPSGGTSGAGPFALSSPAFPDGGTIPQKYECNSADSGAQNISPPLSWGPGPAGTESYAIVLRDLDFGNGFLHWVIWDIPKTTFAVPENIEHVYQPSTPAGAKQAIFAGVVYGYFGPCSPGVDTYELTLYALPDATLPGVDQNTTKQDVATAIVDLALASTTLTGES